MKIILQSGFFFAFIFFSTQSFSQSTEEKAADTPLEKLAVDSQANHPAIVSDAVATTVVPDNFIPARTPVKFFLDTLVSTKTAVPGQQFQLTVAEDVLINNKILIVKGTPATGEVIHAQKAKGFGKAGELLVTIRYIDLNGQRIKMRSFQPYQGSSKATTALVVSQIPYVGLFAGFVQGGNIEMPPQTLVQALVATDTAISVTSNPVPVISGNSATNPENAIQITNGESK